ncbi:lytic murein transglycosylase B [Vreelandella aquamarina]|uniref:lytic murein transglycosylase B n=1 Tax=Vreelandella aquamarina TaxID=77097 RepID=UPI00384E5D82
MTKAREGFRCFCILMYLMAGGGVSSAAVSASEVASFHPDDHPDTAALVAELSAEGLPQHWLHDVLARTSYRQEVLDAMDGAAERRLVWHEYRNIFLKEERIEQGADFMRLHLPTLERASQQFGVPAEIITAIIGVETYYGRFKGKHPVLDSLATLGFHHPTRGAFFRGELAAMLEIAFEQGVDPTELRGSYAGAMGYPQFIPTSYQAYAIDFDKDGIRDLWNNPVDAIGSVANYFAEHNWKAGEPIYQQAEGPQSPPDTIEFNQSSTPTLTLNDVMEVGITPQGQGAEAFMSDPERRVVPLYLHISDVEQDYRLGGFNFYVIMRYNHSHLYAMAVTELAQAIAEKAAVKDAGILKAINGDDMVSERDVQ